MKNGRNYAAQSDPAHNPNFSRAWGGDPLGLPGFRHLDREIGPQAAEDVGRRAIGGWLNRASENHGAVAASAFIKADRIRKKLGLGWDDLINGRRAA